MAIEERLKLQSNPSLYIRQKNVPIHTYIYIEKYPQSSEPYLSTHILFHESVFKQFHMFCVCSHIYPFFLHSMPRGCD